MPIVRRVVLTRCPPKMCRHNDDIEKTFAFWEAHRTSVFLKQSMDRGRASPTHSGGSSPAEASGAGDARGGGSASDASESKEDGDFASYDTKFAGTALQHDSELRVSTCSVPPRRVCPCVSRILQRLRHRYGLCSRTTRPSKCSRTPKCMGKFFAAVATLLQGTESASRGSW